MTKIFLSYRRDDSRTMTERIYDQLRARVGSRNVFKDVDRVPLGKDFRVVLEKEVGKCDAMIVVIGPRWLTIANQAGQRRLDEPDDYVRLEIERALARAIPVIPVLVEGAALPKTADLPPTLQLLPSRQCIEVRADPDFHKDIERLLRASARESRRWLLLPAGILGVFLLGALFISWMTRAGQNEKDTSGVSPGAQDTHQQKETQGILKTISSGHEKVVREQERMRSLLEEIRVNQEALEKVIKENHPRILGPSAAKQEELIKQARELNPEGLPREAVALIQTAEQTIAKAKERLRGHTGPVRHIAFSPDGTLLASASEDCTVKLWDPRKNSLLGTLPISSSSVESVAFSADGKKLAWGWDDSSKLMTRVWNLETNAQEALLQWDEKVRPRSIYALAFSPDGKFLASGSDGPLRIWNLATSKLESSCDWQQSVPSFIDDVAFSPNGRQLAAGCQGGGRNLPDSITVITLGVPSGQKDLVLVSDRKGATAHQGVRGLVRYSSDGKSLIRVTRGNDFGAFNSPAGYMVTWDLTHQAEPESRNVPGGGVYALAMPRGKPALVAAAEGSSRYGDLLNRPPGLPGFGNDKDIATGHTVKLLDLANNQRWDLPTDHKGKVTALAFAPDGDVLATGGADHTVRLWEVAKMRPTGMKNGPE